MVDFNTSKVDGNTVAAVEWNQVADIDNFVTTSGQTPSTSNLNQLGIGAARYSSGGQFYTDSGTANAYVLSPVSPFKAPVDATNGYFDGMTIRFRAGNANTGASTVNVNSAGVKSVKQTDGTTDPTAGMISPNVDTVARYNGTVFIIQGTASQYNVGTSSGQVPLVGTQSATTSLAGLSFLPKVITITNNSGTPNTIIDFGAGVAQADDGSLVFTVSATSKILQNSGAWAAGNNQNGLDTGARANNTPYYCFAIYNPTTLASDILISASKASPTLPSGYTKKCYLGALVTDGSANIRPATWRFGTRGYILTYTTNVNDISNASATEARTVLQTLTAPAGVFVRLSLMLTDNSLTSGKTPRVLFTEINQADVAPTTAQATLLITGNTGNLYNVNNYWQGYTDSSRQIRFRTVDCDASVGVYGDTIGWEELL